MRKFFGEFKEFISRGNVMDMAIGVVVGAAFKAIIDSLVNDIIMPAVGWIIGDIDFASFSIKLSEKVVDGEKVVNAILYGKFINTIISFIIISFCLFLVVKVINGLRRKKEEEPAEPTTKKCPFCCSEIAIEASRCPNCTSELE